jgi:hypothetical protein
VVKKTRIYIATPPIHLHAYCLISEAE